MVTGSASGFLGWFSQWGQVIYFIAQILFWAGVTTAALIAALQFKRLVSYKVGDQPKPADAPAPNVFVE
jgi:hypothetical protein